MMFDLLVPARRKDQKKIDSERAERARDDAKGAIARARHHLRIRQQRVNLEHLMQSPPGRWHDAQLDLAERRGW